MPDQSSAATEHAILQEITAPLETLPDDPLSVIDADFPVSLRGYDRVAVDEYVRHTRQLVAELQATRSPEAAVRRALERVGEQISGVLQRAHDTAEQITAQSRREAEDRLRQARREGNHIAEAAEQRVKELDADTDRIWLERQRIVADAEDLAAQLLALAKVAADRFPTDDDEDEPETAVPYDDAALVAGTPVEAGAPEAENEDEPDDGLQQPPEQEGEPEYGLEQPPEREPDRDDIERTVAFSPLPLSEDETAIMPDTDEPTQLAGEPPEGEAGAPRARPERLTDDESTRVIRPASQAANRRLGGQ